MTNKKLEELKELKSKCRIVKNLQSLKDYVLYVEKDLTFTYDNKSIVAMEKGTLANLAKVHKLFNIDFTLYLQASLNFLLHDLKDEGIKELIIYKAETIAIDEIGKKMVKRKKEK